MYISPKMYHNKEVLHPNWPFGVAYNILYNHVCVLSVHSVLCFPNDYHMVKEEKWNIKPIFHCDAKQFALGPGIGLDTQRHNFALPISTSWYLKTLKFAFPRMPNLKFALPPM